jgi:hypothetical protein
MVDTIDSDARLKKVIRELYKCGSDNRQQKNGGHDTLYQGILTSGHGVKTCGVDGMLPRYLQIYLDTKSLPMNDVDCKGKTASGCEREIAKIILDLYNANRTDVYISITSVGMTHLKRIIDGEELSSGDKRKFFNLFGKYGVIAMQEKTKNRPGKQKYK